MSDDPALKVTCPKCGSVPGTLCWNAAALLERPVPHEERSKLVGEKR